MRIVWDACAPVWSCVSLISVVQAAVIPQFALAQANRTPARLQTFRNLTDQKQAVFEVTGRQAEDARQGAQLPMLIQRQPRGFR
jgi:hypothetical protein